MNHRDKEEHSSKLLHHAVRHLETVLFNSRSFFVTNFYVLHVFCKSSTGIIFEINLMDTRSQKNKNLLNATMLGASFVFLYSFSAVRKSFASVERNWWPLRLAAVKAKMPEYSQRDLRNSISPSCQQQSMNIFLQAACLFAMAQCIEELSFQNETTTEKPRERVSLPPDWRDHSSVNISVAQPKPKKRVKTLDRQAALIKRYR